jgi:hypothetical protein
MELNCLSCVRVVHSLLYSSLTLSLSSHENGENRKKNGKEKKKFVHICGSCAVRCAKTGKSNILYRKTILTNRKKKILIG